MNARNIIKAVVLLCGLASMAGCTHRTIIEEQVPSESATDPSVGVTEGEGSVSNHPLYVRSGDTKIGETQSGPFPEPWEQRLGPFPEPWQRDGDQSDDGTSPPPPSDPNPNPDPNPKP